jgi:hypothetical protein
MTVFARLKDSITSLATPGSVTLERADSSGTNDEGGAVRSGITLRVLPPKVVHPISGSDRTLLPEGIRTRETIVTYVDEYMRTSREFGALADVLIHKPKGAPEANRYIVNTVENWGGVSDHWRAFASREPTG